MSILIVGPGQMGIEYYRVLKKMDIHKISVLGRGQSSAENFFLATGIHPELCSISDFFGRSESRNITEAIVAVNVENLAAISSQLIKLGVKRLLVEKPAGINSDEIRELARITNDYCSEIFVAYNRHFYSSVLMLEKRIAEDGGLQSFFFDFTEWPQTILPHFKNMDVLSNWVLANSSHVIDLAFQIGGRPKYLHAHTSGSLAWHPRASRFAGSGETQEGCLFAYTSNWQSAGRWGLDFYTKEYRYILRPLEKLQAQKQGSLSVEMIALDDHFDIEFKPGLFLEVEAFLEASNNPRLITLDEHLKNVVEIIEPISGKEA